MSRFNKISCIILTGLILSGCAGRSIRKETKTNFLPMKNSQSEETQTAQQKKNYQIEQGKEASAAEENLPGKKIKTEGWRIQAGCSKITEKLAQDVYQEVLGLNQELYAGIYEMKNSRMVFLSEETKENEVEVRAVFEADYTGIRKPEDYPLIQGMFEVKDQLETDEEKQIADEYINGWLKELNPFYQATDRVPMEIVVKFDAENQEEYELYYPFVKNSKEKLKPLRKYAEKYCKEDEEKMRQQGRERLYEELDIESNL